MTSGDDTDGRRDEPPYDEVSEVEQPPDEDRDESVEETVGQGPPDVLLDVPHLSVDEITLEVDELRAHVSLQAEVLKLLNLNVGADVDLGRVSLEITGVQAQAQLKVRLDRVAQIIDRVLTTIDHNPQILKRVGRAIEQAPHDVGSAAGDIGAETSRAAGQLAPGADEASGENGRSAGEAGDGTGRVRPRRVAREDQPRRLSPGRRRGSGP